MATNKKRGQRSRPAKPAPADLDDTAFDNVNVADEPDDTEALADAVDALADPDALDPEPEAEPELELTAGGRELFVREPLLVHIAERRDEDGKVVAAERRLRLAIGDRVPRGVISRRKLLDFGRRGLISVRPPPETGQAQRRSA